ARRAIRPLRAPERTASDARGLPVDGGEDTRSNGMTPKALAESLTGIEYSAVVRVLYGSDLMKLAKAHGLVVAYGFSDDLLEFDGAMHDEFSCYGGGTVLIDANGLLPSFKAASEDEDACRHYFERK